VISLTKKQMGSGNRRLDKLESHLTPKQAVMLWMAEAHQFETLEEYACHMKTQPDNAWPLRRLGDQMTASVEQALMGRPKDEINWAVRVIGSSRYNGRRVSPLNRKCCI